jgi:malate dehydrogenase (oxaloacetate-decarboxylating)
MAKFDIKLTNLDGIFPDYKDEQLAKAKTLFLKEMALRMHRFYKGKMMTVPKAGVYGFNWFNVWYTPGVSKISTTIRDDNNMSYELSNRGNLVGVVSDSTRVLGDGDVTPSGGLGVMEGKAFLMKYLGGMDAVALCINSYNKKGVHDPKKIIDFVMMAAPSLGAVNLEDISQPNCYIVLDTLRKECDIPVWHDDAQGTGSVILAGLLNAFKLTKRNIKDTKFVFFGAGAANSQTANLVMAAGAKGENIVMFDVDGALSTKRTEYKKKKSFYRQWDLCTKTNPRCVTDITEALKGADVLIAASKPGPDTIKPEWIKGMNEKSIVFACANPVPEIWPFAAKQAGAYITATGRGDFPNQVNNSLGFPGILKGALIVRAKTITDNMAIAAAESMAGYQAKKDMGPDSIMPKMSDHDVFSEEAAAVAMQAIKDGVARLNMTREEVKKIAQRDIDEARAITAKLMEIGVIQEPPEELFEEAVKLVKKEIGAPKHMAAGK